jgi:urease accessory protein
MWCDSILGNLEDVAAQSRWRTKKIDWVDVQWHECGQRALNTSSRAGNVVRVLLPLGITLNHADVLIESTDHVVAVNIVPIEVLIVRPRNPLEMGLLALEIGNLHAPAQVVGDEMWIMPDGPVEAVLSRMGLECRCETRRFNPLPCTTATTVGLSSDFAIRIVAPPSNQREREDAKAPRKREG